MKEPAEVLNRIDLAEICQHLENGSLYSVNWLPAHYMAADPLTNDNRETASLLQKILSISEYPLHPTRISRITPNGEVLNDQNL